MISCGPRGTGRCAPEISATDADGHQLSVRRSKLAGDLLCPRIDVRPLAVVARLSTEGFEQEPRPCGPVIEIDDARKDAIVARVKCVFELADLLGLLLDQCSDNGVSIAERSDAEQPHG